MQPASPSVPTTWCGGSTCLKAIPTDLSHLPPTHCTKSHTCQINLCLGPLLHCPSLPHPPLSKKGKGIGFKWYASNILSHVLLSRSTQGTSLVWHSLAGRWNSHYEDAVLTLSTVTIQQPSVCMSILKSIKIHISWPLLKLSNLEIQQFYALPDHSPHPGQQ